MYGFFAANSKGADGCVVVLEDDGAVIHDDDVVQELENKHSGNGSKKSRFLEVSC